MWVRTQSRESLMKCEEFTLHYLISQDKWAIVTNFKEEVDGFSLFDVLGEYQTKERAMEVLEDIQECFLGYPTKNFNIGVDSPLLGREFHSVYEMPAE